METKAVVLHGWQEARFGLALLITIRQEFGLCCQWRWSSSMAVIVQVADINLVLCLNDRFRKLQGHHRAQSGQLISFDRRSAIPHRPVAPTMPFVLRIQNKVKI